MTDVPLTRSVRLIFEFAADGVRLLEQHPVNVTVGLFRDQDAGDYVEVRNRDGRTISRVPVWAGIGSNVETFPQDPYISSDTPRVLTVVVPPRPMRTTSRSSETAEPTVRTPIAPASRSSALFAFHPDYVNPPPSGPAP
ncbi:hypothetical protein [Lentzea nigeriaca]|uniref:hypothetical protein n=1 Tax=Lentzea nigeriaca TaxID=1128665 RepID=UPI001957C7C3|nr:hypothetical protein [Lentzea nigeriaca]MBM7862057.1 hypothetical protein [Lentzea nigeriaca]